MYAYTYDTAVDGHGLLQQLASVLLLAESVRDCDVYHVVHNVNIKHCTGLKIHTKAIPSE